MDYFQHSAHDQKCERAKQKHRGSTALLDADTLCAWCVFHHVPLPLDPRHNFSLSGAPLNQPGLNNLLENPSNNKTTTNNRAVKGLLPTKK